MHPWCDEQAKKIPSYDCNETNVWLFDTIPSIIRDNMLGIWLEQNFQTSKCAMRIMTKIQCSRRTNIQETENVKKIHISLNLFYTHSISAFT